MDMIFLKMQSSLRVKVRSDSLSSCHVFEILVENIKSELVKPRMINLTDDLQSVIYVMTNFYAFISLGLKTPAPK
jgi:hypothetical protein